MGRLDGKVAIITGAGSGMGRAAAILFAKERAEVVVADIAVEGAEETVRAIKEAGGEAIYVKTDVSKAEDVKNMVRAAVNTYRKLDILYNNAAIQGDATSTVDLTEENWEKVIAVNLKGVWLGMKYAIPEMLKTGGGSIISITSQAAERGVPNCQVYCVSKGGIAALSRATAMEFAKKNIRVNCISPGAIATPMTLQMIARDPELKKNLLAMIPQGRLGEAEEVAQAALFLASDESSHITGHALAVDGGWLANSGQSVAAD